MPERRLAVVGNGLGDMPDPAGVLDAGLEVAYQPIVHLGSGQVIAYEALARPRHPETSSPLEFFSALERAGLRLAGERVAFAAAMAGWSPRRQREKLFVNASPLTLVDDGFEVAELLELADRHDLAPSDLVIEVTESEAVDDIEALTLRVRRLRRLGIGVAVDDAGAGHASFRVITRLRPSYIKLDRDLVHGVDSDGARHAFIEAMVRFARQIGSRLIAEGIETEAELASLAGLGVEAGQGFFLARPGIGEFSRPSDDARRLIAGAAQRLRLGAVQVTVGELARPATLLDPDATVEEAYTRFCANPAVGVFVLDNDHGVDAQVSRRGLERLLSAPGAWERLASRPVRDVAEHEPLRVGAQLDVAEVGSILAARHAQEVVDDVAVTDPRGGIVGIVDVRAIVRTLADVRKQRQDDLNPLTGLPGLEWAEQELERRLDGGEATTVVFLDVDGFRTVNHLGGFALGDQVIRLMGRCLTGVTGGISHAGVAHAGGDQFVILVPPRRYEELVAEVVRSIESEVMPQVRTELRTRDAVETFATLGVSLAGTDLYGAPPPGLRYLDWARDRLSGPIRTAKDIVGYSSVHHTCERTTIATWTPRTSGRRTLALGLAEPSVVLRALDLIDRCWDRWWQVQEAEQPGVADLAERFPGPPEAIEGLRRRYALPLRTRAEELARTGHPVMEVTLEGEESELLDLLDRLALITQFAQESASVPIPPEVMLLDRMLRQRARAIVRRDSSMTDAVAPARRDP